MVTKLEGAKEADAVAVAVEREKLNPECSLEKKNPPRIVENKISIDNFRRILWKRS